MEPYLTELRQLKNSEWPAAFAVSVKAMKTRPKFLAGLLALVVGFILLAGGLFIALQPSEFEAVARIKVDYKPDPNSYDPYFLLTEFEIIQSRVVLDKVIGSQNLNEKWGEKYNGGQRLGAAEVEQMLKRKLELRPIQNTRLIEMHVFDEDPNEAAALANSIAEAYCEYTTERYDKASAAALEQVMKEVEAQDVARVWSLEQKLEKQRRELNISDETTISNQPAAAAYLATKKELENARRYLEIDKRCYEGLIDVPGPSPAEIVLPASVPEAPIFLDRPLGFAMLTSGLALIIGGIVCLRKLETEPANS